MDSLTAFFADRPELPQLLFFAGAIGFCFWARARALNGSTSRSALSRRRDKRPGWIARRRARGGIRHPRDRVGVGYTSATRSVHLSLRELAGHGLTVGGPGSGKTTFLQLLVDASAGRVPCVIVDPKGSPALETTVRAHGGVVWTLDGRTPADLLDPRPWQVPDLLLEAEDYSADARAYRDAAHQRALWAAWSLALDGNPMDLAELRRRLDRETLTVALERHRTRDPRITDWLQRLDHQRGGIEDSGARGLDRALGTLLDGVALRGSLRTCPEALRLDDVLETNGLVLFSLDAAEYPHATRKVASWILLGMARVVRQVANGASNCAGALSALLLVDEVGALGNSAHHLRGLVGRARESGLAVVLATQGLTDLEAVDRPLVDQVLQDTAFQLIFRQGGPRDAHLVEQLFGQAWMIDESWSNDGRVTKRQVERSRVSIDEWMNGLHPGDAWLRVAPVDRGWRQEHVRVALPRPSPLNTERGIVRSGVRIAESDSKAGSTRREYPSGVSETPQAPRQPALAAVPPECPAELAERMGADILAKCERRWSRKHHELGPCLVWTGPSTTDSKGRTYGRVYDAAIGRTDYTHRVVWRRCYGPIPKGGTVDHLCEITLCQRPDHLDSEAVTRSENTRRRHQREG